MQKSSVTLDAIQLVGISARTSNQQEFNPDTAVIPKTLGQFFTENLAQKILHRTNPGVLYCAYANYASDHNGEYTYFVGEQVDDLADQTLEVLKIPKQHYTQFTTPTGKMPDVCIQAWQAIWAMDASSMGGERNFVADFERYDERSQDPNNAVLDIYIGLHSE